MNGKKIIAATMLGMMAFGGAINVSATEGSVDTQGHGHHPHVKKSDINVNVKKKQEVLLLNGLNDMTFNLEKSYNGSTLKGEVTEVGDVKVYASTKKAKWDVKAKLEGDRLLVIGREKKATYVSVKEFYVEPKRSNEPKVSLIGATGEGNVIHQSGSNGHEDIYTRTFNKATLKVEDSKDIKSGKSLTGTIQYTLENVAFD